MEVNLFKLVSTSKHDKWHDSPELFISRTTRENKDYVLPNLSKTSEKRCEKQQWKLDKNHENEFNKIKSEVIDIAGQQTVNVLHHLGLDPLTMF